MLSKHHRCNSKQDVLNVEYAPLYDVICTYSSHKGLVYTDFAVT